MVLTNKSSKDEIEKEIERLKNLIEKTFPVERVFYFHREKDENFNMCDELGFEGEAAENFLNSGYEVKATCIIYESGKTFITHINDMPLKYFGVLI